MPIVVPDDLIASFRERGYVVVPKLLGHDELDRYRDLVTSGGVYPDPA